MRLSYLLLASSMMATSDAFSVSAPQCSRFPLARRAVSIRMSPNVPPTLLTAAADSDFTSAMPAKPEQDMEEKLAESATEFIATLTGQLGEGVDPPPEVEALKEARDSGAKPEVLTRLMYELMIEQGMIYDQDPETGTLTPTEWDIKENLEAPEVKREFIYLYNYGMTLIAKGLLGVDEVKEIVKDRLIARTGKTPEEFDAWLGY